MFFCEAIYLFFCGNVEDECNKQIQTDSKFYAKMLEIEQFQRLGCSIVTKKLKNYNLA